MQNYFITIAIYRKSPENLGMFAGGTPVIALDTNVLVRYLAQDDARQSAAASRLIEQTLNGMALT